MLDYYGDALEVLPNKYNEIYYLFGRSACNDNNTNNKLSLYNTKNK